jgi:serine/threonine protein kinase
MNDSSRAPGQVVGQYILDSLLGVGGMAEVWLARHRSLETPVAVKFLNSRYAGHLEVEARFLEEGKLQARLTTLNTRSANILPVLDYLVEDGRSYLIMRYIDGIGLDKRIQDARGPLPIKETRAIARDVLGALGFAHSQNVIHRDVKPSNVLLEDGKHAFLMDFGIAVARNSANERRLTQYGAVLGTYQYMSPEQMRSSREVTPASDIYSFGCMLYEMLTGKAVFDPENQATDHELRLMHDTQVPLSPRTFHPDTPPELEWVTMRCLAKLPEDRFPSCEAVLEALDGGMQRQSTVIEPRSPGSHRLVTVVEQYNPVHPEDIRTGSSGRMAAQQFSERMTLPPGWPSLAPVGPETHRPAPEMPSVPRVLASPESQKAKSKKYMIVGASLTGILVLAGGIAIWEHADRNPSVAPKPHSTLSQVAAPVFDPPSGSLKKTQRISITDSTPGTTIYYTMDGSQPTTASQRYIAPVPVAPGTSLQAIAIENGYGNSPVSSADYAAAKDLGSNQTGPNGSTTKPLALTLAPVFSPVGGRYGAAQTVTLSPSTPGSRIKYQTDSGSGAGPMRPYAGPISVTSSERITAIAQVSGAKDSQPVSESYVIGAALGTMRWMGSVTQNQTITFYPNGQVSVGKVQGLAYPAAPVRIEVSPATLYTIVRQPTAANGWRLVLRANYGGDAIVTIRWTTAG